MFLGRNIGQIWDILIETQLNAVENHPIDGVRGTASLIPKVSTRLYSVSMSSARGWCFDVVAPTAVISYRKSRPYLYTNYLCQCELECLLLIAKHNHCLRESCH